MVKNLVSVIIPTYNRAHTITRALNSVKNQSYNFMEIIIVDDAGSDGTDKVLKEYDFGNIPCTYIYHERNLGPGRARNTGMMSAKGEYLAFIDSDDEWCNNDKIQIQVQFLQDNSTYGLVATAHSVMYNNLDKTVLRFIDDDSFRKIALKYCPAHTSTWVFRRNLFEKIGGFWAYGAEDYEYLLRIGCQGKCYCLPIVTENYFNSSEGDYKGHITRNLIWTFCVCIKYGFQYPYFLSSLLNRFTRLYQKIRYYFI